MSFPHLTHEWGTKIGRFGGDKSRQLKGLTETIEQW
jgi:hypothetical protein